MRTDWMEKRGQRGNTLLEFTFVAATFFMMLLAITSGANLYFTHNALTEATRRGARFAATQAANSTAGTITSCGPPGCGPSLTAIRNYAIYGNAAGTGPKLIATLQPANVSIEYASFGVGTGTVSVSITGYTYNVVIPGLSRRITMPEYRTTSAGESAGTSPAPASCP